jgi:hypothetical protein
VRIAHEQAYAQRCLHRYHPPAGLRYGDYAYRHVARGTPVAAESRRNGVAQPYDDYW